MEVVKKFFPHILHDNEETYFASLMGVIESIDELAIVEIIKTPTSYKFRISTSLPKYNKMLLEEILKFHNVYKLRIEMSKSISTSATIAFNISLSS